MSRAVLGAARRNAVSIRPPAVAVGKLCGSPAAAWGLGLRGASMQQRCFCSDPDDKRATWGDKGYSNQSPIYGIKELPKGAEHGRCRALIYRSKQRGWLELDLLLGEFALRQLPVSAVPTRPLSSSPSPPHVLRRSPHACCCPPQKQELLRSPARKDTC